MSFKKVSEWFGKLPIWMQIALIALPAATLGMLINGQNSPGFVIISGIKDLLNGKLPQ